jgi:hypothetical protein
VALDLAHGKLSGSLRWGQVAGFATNGILRASDRTLSLLDPVTLRATWTIPVPPAGEGPGQATASAGVVAQVVPSVSGAMQVVVGYG